MLRNQPGARAKLQHPFPCNDGTDTVVHLLIGGAVLFHKQVVHRRIKVPNRVLCLRRRALCRHDAAGSRSHRARHRQRSRFASVHFLSLHWHRIHIVFSLRCSHVDKPSIRYLFFALNLNSLAVRFAMSIDNTMPRITAIGKAQVGLQFISVSAYPAGISSTAAS